MVETSKVVGFYTDAFGNEINEYEMVENYSVSYKGKIFEGDTDGYNTHGYDKWEDAKAVYDAYPDIVSIHDNEYGVTFEKGEWF